MNTQVSLRRQNVDDMSGTLNIPNSSSLVLRDRGGEQTPMLQSCHIGRGKARRVWPTIRHDMRLRDGHLHQNTIYHGEAVQKPLGIKLHWSRIKRGVSCSLRVGRGANRPISKESSLSIAFLSYSSGALPLFYLFFIICPWTLSRRS